MATTVFLLSTAATTHRGTNTAKLNASTSGWAPLATSTSRGAGVAAYSSNTVTGATNGIESGQASLSGPAEWITPPVDQDVTISGTITANVWASESSMNANVAINVKIDKLAATDGTITQIVKSTRTTEVAVTTRAVNNFTTGMTAADYTDVSLNKGDRLRITVFGDDAGTMASGFLFDIGVAGTTGGADGDTFVTFTETFGFQTTDPTGTTIYLTNTASAVSTADTDWEAWTSPGNAATSITRSSLSAGWAAPQQLDFTNPISWFTRPLAAFSLDGVVKVNAWYQSGATTMNISAGIEIAVVAGDGSGATVWGYANRDAATTSGSAGELSTSVTAYTWYVAGDTTAVSDGQRIRIRSFFDDCADAPIAVTAGCNMRIDGPTGGVDGDTFLIFPQTLSEQVAGAAPPPPRLKPMRWMYDFDPWSATGWL